MDDEMRDIQYSLCSKIEWCQALEEVIGTTSSAISFSDFECMHSKFPGSIPDFTERLIYHEKATSQNINSLSSSLRLLITR